MRTVAYKTPLSMKTIKPELSRRLPDDYVLEYTFVDAQPENSLKAEDGWLFMAEDQFNVMIATCNKKELIKQKCKIVQQEKHAAILKFLDEQRVKLEQKQQAEQQLLAEFEAFKAWKASQNQ